MRYIYSNNLMGIVVILASGLGAEDMKIEISIPVFFFSLGFPLPVPF